MRDMKLTSMLTLPGNDLIVAGIRDLQERRESKEDLRLNIELASPDDFIPAQSHGDSLCFGEHMHFRLCVSF